MNNATINAALADPACQRLAEWAAIGPVQRAALESFADRIAPPAELTDARLLEMAAEAETPAWGEWFSDEDALIRFARAVLAA